MPEGITAIAVWHSNSWTTCRAYTDACPEGEQRDLDDEAAYQLARLVNQEIRYGNGSVRPFLCEGCVGWYWQRGETDD